MRAVVLREFGGADVLQVDELPTPVPGPDEVLVKVGGVSVNRGLDVSVRRGRYARLPPLPHVLGADPVGTVVEVGSGVSDRRPGDRVACGNFIGVQAGGLPVQLGVDVWGGYAELVKLPARFTTPIPSGLDLHTATVIARHAPLALTHLRDRARVKPGEWVLVMGAAGGLGSVSVQVAKALGASVIAAAGTAERVRAAVELGADAGVDYRAEDLAAEVRRITGGAGANVVLESIGDPELFPAAVDSLARGGRLITAGADGGPGVVPLNVRQLYLKEASILGAPRNGPGTEHAALALAAEGRLRVLVDRVLPLADAAAAHELVESRSNIGKILLDPTLP